MIEIEFNSFHTNTHRSEKGGSSRVRVLCRNWSEHTDDRLASNHHLAMIRRTHHINGGRAIARCANAIDRSIYESNPIDRRHNTTHRIYLLHAANIKCLQTNSAYILFGSTASHSGNREIREVRWWDGHDDDDAVASLLHLNLHVWQPADALLLDTKHTHLCHRHRLGFTPHKQTLQTIKPAATMTGRILGDQYTTRIVRRSVF